MRQTTVLAASTAMAPLAIFGATCGGASGTTPSQSPPPAQTSQTWSDEFNGPAGAAPDPAKWTYDLGTNNGWGNNELESYTSSPQNVRMDGDGRLVIRVERNGSGYTSARLKTQGLFSTTHGRVEARIKLPHGQGIWPAFWMLGADITTVGWPGCGEIDIMENIGREPSVVHGTIHGPGYSGGNGVSALFTLPGGARFADDFHVFAAEWGTRTITFSVDGNDYKTVTPSSLPNNATWVFEKPFFVLLNVAVGGNWPGNPDATTTFPQEMLVDYVRVTSR